MRKEVRKRYTFNHPCLIETNNAEYIMILYKLSSFSSSGIYIAKYPGRISSSVGFNRLFRGLFLCCVSSP